MDEMSDDDDEYIYENEDDAELSSDDGKNRTNVNRFSKGSTNRTSNASMMHEGSEEVTVLDETKLQELMDGVVTEISNVINVPTDSAMALLRFFNWNCEKLYDQFYANPESVVEKVGIRNSEEQDADVMRSRKGKSMKCRICNEDVEDTLALPCEHYFCIQCWGLYLKNAVSLGPPCVYTTCPEYKCPQIVTEAIFLMHLSNEEMFRYRDFSLRSFVDINKRLRFCPGAGCNKVVQAPRSCPHVRCLCGEAFCFKCGDEAHEPVPCPDLGYWREKCSNESETANWILANTKQCPKCDTRIEKNQGCNHMTCRQCKAEFCWICTGNWSDHGTSTGGFYKCNRYTSEATDGMSDVARAKAELERYLHYYKRFQNHAEAQKFAQKQMSMRTELRMTDLLEKQGVGWIDVQYLQDATQQLIECRRALKYTYVFGYYMTDPMKKQQRDLFEHHQENLEKFTEHLSDLTEQPLECINRADVINYTRVTDRFLTSLLESVHDGLTDVGQGLRASN